MNRAEKRAAALRELAKEFGIVPGDETTTAGEDLPEYLGEPEKLGRWAAVTTAQGDSGYAINYVYPCETRAEARRRSASYLRSDIFPEYPVCVVNLDTGRGWFAELGVLRWSEAQWPGVGGGTMSRVDSRVGPPS
jgi:hypothetical protein